MARKKTDLIIIHCAATRPNQDIGAYEIDRWHRQRGFLKIGYHFVIRRDGSVETGRALEEVGAHAVNYNSRSVGICMVGGVDDKLKPQDNFTPAQWETLEQVVKKLTAEYPDAQVIGHRDVDPRKACPSFDAIKWWKGIRS